MTNVISLARTRVAPIVQTTAQTPDPIAHQAAIENALSMALYYVRQPAHSPAMLQAATARANRALSLLKQACSASATTSLEG